MTFNKNIKFLQGLQLKVSHPRLMDPAPSNDELAECYKAAFRSPDHAYLRPWRFIECRGEERRRFGELIGQAMAADADLIDAQRLKFQNAPLRAPLVIICYADVTSHAKVPEIEQLLSVGCAVNNFSLALYDLGFGSVWRTGEPAYSPSLHQLLGLTQNQKIVGFLYVGTSSGEDKEIPLLRNEDFVCTFSDKLSADSF
jgi:nitroreductase